MLTDAKKKPVQPEKQISAEEEQKTLQCFSSTIEAIVYRNLRHE